MIHDYEAYSAVFSPRGGYLASESGHPFKGISITRVWELEAGRELNRRNPGLGARRILFSADGRRLIAQGGSVQDVWLWKPDDLIEETCARVHRNLTAEEWKRNLGKILYSKTCPKLP